MKEKDRKTKKEGEKKQPTEKGGMKGQHTEKERERKTNH